MVQRYSCTERIGVNAVERIILSFGWIFREQLVSDIGVDAQVEVCDKGHPSGRLLALQIKSGKSWFKKQSPEGWVYRGTLKHLDYWTAHSLPVIIILHNPESCKTWWTLVHDQTVKRTRLGWNILVPFSQELDASAKDILSPIALLGYSQRQRLESITKKIELTRNAANHSSVSLLIHALQSAERSIDIATSYLSNELLWVLKTVSHNIPIRIIMPDYNISIYSNSPHHVKDTNHEVITEFTNHREEHPQLTIRLCYQLHAKVILIDHTLAIYGSANLTSIGLRKISEIFMASNDYSVVSLYSDNFVNLWQKSKPLIL